MNDRSLPRSIRLDATTHCQLRCPSCPTAAGRIANDLGQGFVRFNDFQKLLDENPFVMHVELSNWGELFLNPDLLKIMKYSFERGIALTATNGVNLNTVKDEVLAGLVQYQFRHLTCSLDGASHESYVKYRRRGQFDQVIANIQSINRHKRRLDSDFPLLTWQFIAFGHNEHEIETAREMAWDLDMDFHLKLSWDPDFSPVKDKKLERVPHDQSGTEKERTDTDDPVKDKTKARPDNENAIPKSIQNQPPEEPYLLKSRCSQLWNFPQINWDGRVLGCCVNTWGDFGNAYESGLKSTLNGDALVYGRRMLRGIEEPKEDIPCTICRHYKWMRNNEQWMTEKDITATRRFYRMPYEFGRFGIRLANRFPRLARLYLRIMGLRRRKRAA